MNSTGGINQGALLASAGRTLGLDLDETLELVQAVANRGPETNDTQKLRRFLERAGRKRRSEERRGGLGTIDDEMKQELLALGINPDTYRAGEDFDRYNGMPGEIGRAIYLEEDGSADFQNFGGIDSNNQVKNAYDQIEEQSRARKSSGRQPTYVAPANRPSLEEWADIQIKNGANPNAIERMVYSFKQAGITDPVGELQKARDFGVKDVTTRPAREQSVQDSITEANKSLGRVAIRNEDGYPSRAVWQPSGDLDVRAVNAINDSGTYVPGPNDALIREYRGQIAGLGELDPETLEVLRLNEQKAGVGLKAIAQMGNTYRVPGGVGKYVEDRKKGKARYKYRDFGDNTNAGVAPQSASNDAITRLRTKLNSGELSVLETEQAIRLLSRMEGRLPGNEKLAMREATKGMIATDNRRFTSEEIDSIVDIELQNRFGPTAPSGGRKVIPAGKQNASSDTKNAVESELRTRLVGRGGVNQAKQNENLDMAVAISEAERGRPAIEDAVRTQGPNSIAVLRNGEYYNPRYQNELIGEGSPALAKLEQLMKSAEINVDGEIIKPDTGSAMEWAQSRLFDEYDKPETLGNPDFLDGEIEMNRALGQLDQKFSAAGLGATSAKDLNGLEVKAREYWDQKRSKTKDGKFYMKMPDKSQKYIENFSIDAVLADMRFGSADVKNIARTFYTLELAKQSPVNRVDKDAFAEGGERVRRTRQVRTSLDAPLTRVPEQPIVTGLKKGRNIDIARMDRASIKGEGEIKPMIKAINNESRIRDEINAEVENLRNNGGTIRDLGNGSVQQLNEQQIRQEAEGLVRARNMLMEAETDGAVRYIRGAEDTYDIEKDVRSPFVGVAEGDMKTVKRKGKGLVEMQKGGGAQELDARVFQGMTDGQLQHYFASKGYPSEKAAEFIAGAQGLRARQANLAEDIANNSFAERTRVGPATGVEATIRQEAAARPSMTTEQKLGGPRAMQGADSLPSEVKGERGASTFRNIAFPRKLEETQRQTEDFALGLKARARGTGERLTPREQVFGKGIASESELRMRGEGPGIETPGEKRTRAFMNDIPAFDPGMSMAGIKGEVQRRQITDAPQITSSPVSFSEPEIQAPAQQRPRLQRSTNREKNVTPTSYFDSATATAGLAPRDIPEPKSFPEQMEDAKGFWNKVKDYATNDKYQRRRRIGYGVGGGLLGIAGLNEMISGERRERNPQEQY